MKELYWKYSLIIFIIVMGLFLVRQAQPFTNGILGAFTLFVMLRRPTYRLQKRIKPNAAVWIMTIATVLFILIPVSLLGWLLVNELVSMNLNPKEIIAPIIQIIRLIKEKTGFDVLSENTITYLASQIPAWGQSLMYGVSDVLMNIVVAVMLLYFMLSGGEKMEAYIATLLPFKEENKKDVLTQIKLIVRSNAIGIPLLALIQGIIALGGYLLSSAPNPLLAALLTAFASVIPLVGTALIWVPIALYLLIMGDWINALILLGYGGIIVSQCDNLIRFILQKKMADTHPLVTIFGVVAGLPVFGFMGVIFGPLLVSLFLLFVEMFRKEYLLEPSSK